MRGETQTCPPSHCTPILQVPPNGLVLYTGTILTEEGKEKKVNIDFEPFKPINTSLYLCDNKFHTEALAELLESDNRWGGEGVTEGRWSERCALRGGGTAPVASHHGVEAPPPLGSGPQPRARHTNPTATASL